MQKKVKCYLRVNLRTMAVKVTKNKQQIGSMEVQVELNLKFNLPENNNAVVDAEFDVPEIKVAEMVSKMI
jgi:hypothetical protein